MNPGFFGALWIVLRKEWLDFVRDRRTLLLSLLVAPLLYPLLLIGMGQLTEWRTQTELQQELLLPVAGMEQAPNLMRFLAGYGVRAQPAPPDIEARVRRQQEDLALRLAPDFAADWQAGRPARVDIITDTTRRTGDVKVLRLRQLLRAYGSSTASKRLLIRGLDPALVAPLHVGTHDLATSAARRSQALSLLLPMLLTIFAFVGGAHLAMDTTAGERERQSLEPLLTVPVPRAALVGGKLLASVLLGLASLLLILLSFKLSASVAGGMARQLDVSVVAMLRLLMALLPLVVMGAALITVLAAGARSMKEAQSHLMWLMLLPMVPVFALLAYPVKDTVLWQYAVPFLAQSQLIQKITRGETASPLQWLVYLTTSLLLATLLWALAVWRYKQERLAISA